MHRLFKARTVVRDVYATVMSLPLAPDMNLAAFLNRRSETTCVSNEFKEGILHFNPMAEYEDIVLQHINHEPVIRANACDCGEKSVHRNLFGL